MPEGIFQWSAFSHVDRVEPLCSAIARMNFLFRNVITVRCSALRPQNLRVSGGNVWEVSRKEHVLTGAARTREHDVV